MVAGGEAHVIIARETWDDVLRLQRPLAGAPARARLTVSDSTVCDARRTAVDEVGIGLVGYGTVGSGVGRLLHEGADEIRLATGKNVRLRTVCDLSPERRAQVPEGVRTTTDFAELVADPAIQIVIELIGGIEPARTIQLAALAAGKSVVTANKQLLSQHGAELLQAAEDSGTFLRFEASSVGAVPVIKVLRESLAAARITGRHGHRQRHDQLHPLGHGAERRRVRPHARARPGAGLRRSRPHRRRDRQRRGRQDGHPLVDRLPQPRQLERRRTPGHRVDHRRRRGLRQGPRPGAQAARRGQADRRPRQRARLPLFHSRPSTRWPASRAPTTPCSSSRTASTTSCSSAPARAARRPPRR